ncbi:hypothetical protein V8C34DRAFT_287810 [Trichoderma compactum]
MSSTITASDSLRAIASTQAVVGPRISKSSPLASQQAVERHNEVDSASPVAFPSQEPLTGMVRISDASLNPILQIKIAITKAYHQIREEVNDLRNALGGFKHTTIRNQLLMRLNNLLDEQEIAELCNQNYSQLNEFIVVGNKLSSYIENLKEMIQKAEELRPDRPSEVQLFITVNRPRAEIEGRKIMQKLKKTLYGVSLAVNILIPSAEAAASREELLQNELSRMQDQLASLRRRGSVIQMPEPDSDGSTVQTPIVSSRPAVNFEYLEKLGYSPSKPYQDVPQAYSKRYEYLINCAPPESTMWLFHNEEFLDWVYSPSVRVLSCVGHCGTGKSVISAKVVDWLQQASFQRVYFHLGVSKVQTATGVALALLAQLRALLLTKPPLSRPAHLVKSPGGFSVKNPPTAEARLNPATAIAGPSSFSERDMMDLQTQQVSPPPSILDEASPDMPSTVPIDGEQFLHEVGKNIESWNTSETANEDGGRTIPESNKIPELPKIPEFPKVPELPRLLKQVEDACHNCQDELFIVLDGWDDDNMVNPDGFRLLLNSLVRKTCRVFITSRSKIEDNERFSVTRISLDAHTATTPQQEDIMRYIEKLLLDNPEGKNQLMQYKFLPKIISTTLKGRFDMARIMTTACISILEQPYRLYWPSFQVKNFLEQLAASGNIIQKGSLFGRQASKDNGKDLLLGWLVMSPTPLTEPMLRMFFNEVYRVWKVFLDKNLQLDTKDPESQHHDSTDDQVHDLDLGAILQSCEPFVIIDYGNHIVQFNSVEAGGLVVQHVLENEGRWLSIAVAVVTTYLDHLDDTEDFAKGLCATEKELVDLLGKHAFLYQAAHLARYMSLLVGTTFQGSKEIQEKFVKLLDSPKIFLLLQISLYTGEDDYKYGENPSWEESIKFIQSLSQLHIAARLGQLEQVNALLEADNSSATEVSTRGSFPLHEAAKSGVVAVVNTLLRACPDIVHKVDKIGNTPLFYACRGRHKNAIIVLFEAQCSSQLSDEPDLTTYDNDLDDALPLYCLAKSDKENSDEGLRMDIALLRTVESGLDRVAKFLVDKGANANRDFSGTTALSLAIQNSKEELAEIFISKNTDPMTKLANGRQPLLHGAVERRMERTVLKLLASEKLDINCRDANQRTALFSAIEVGDEEWAMLMTKKFLSRGLRVDDRDKEDNHILHIIAEKGYRNVFSEILLSSRYIEEPKNKDGKTPFDIAVEHKHRDIITYLRPTYKFDET